MLKVTAGSTLLSLVLIMTLPAPWLVAFHVVAVISWMAGLLYLPRIFVYHSQASMGLETKAVFKVMERKLYWFIMSPAAVMSVILGFWLAFAKFQFIGFWLHAKMSLAVILIGFHLYLGRELVRFATDTNEKSEKFWRMMNEIPTILMIGIVFLVILKP